MTDLNQKSDSFKKSDRSSNFSSDKSICPNNKSNRSADWEPYQEGF